MAKRGRHKVPNPSFEGTLREKPRKAPQFKRWASWFLRITFHNQLVRIGGAMKQFALSFLAVTLLGITSVGQAAEEEKKPEAKPPKEESFWDTFGVGLAVTTNLGRERSIQEAQLVNGIVRVTSERQVVPRLMLEKHWYFRDDWKGGYKPGMFVGASLLGERQVMDAVALGALVGFKPNSGTTTTHNLGIGIALQPYSRVLGDGLTKDQPLPAGETQIRYKETNRTALILFYTYTPGN